MNLWTNKIPAAKLDAGMTNDGEWYDAEMLKWNGLIYYKKYDD